MTVNVVLVVWDTVRGIETVPADESLTPTLAALAEAGTEYTGAFAPAPWSVPAHGSLFTGTYPSAHGAHAESAFLDGRLPTLAECFRDAGYETAGVSNNTWIAGEFGFDRGFDSFHEQTIRRAGRADPDGSTAGLDLGALREIQGRRPDGPESSHADEGAARTVGRIRRWLGRRPDDDPFFLFANFVEGHLEYRPPERVVERHLPDGWSYEEATALPQDPRAFDAGRFEPTAEEWSVLRGLYRGEIAYLDEQLGRLRAALEAAGVWDETVLVVTSDHGENVGEHGFLGHQYCLYDTLLHVPLVVHGGAFSGGADGSDGLVGLVDLAPTLLDAAGIEAPAARDGLQGRSIHPSRGNAERRHVFAEYRGPRPPVERLEARFGDVPDRLYDLQRSLLAVRTPRRKYVRGSDGSAELYDLAADPAETNDLADDRPDVAAALDSTLESWHASFDHAEASESAAISPSTERRLADLGYM